MKKTSKIFGHFFLAMTVVTGCAAIGGHTHHFATMIFSAIMASALYHDCRPRKILKAR